MSKRRRSKKASPKKPDVLPADHGRLQHGSDEPKLVVTGAAFQLFDTWIDSQLQTLVDRWIHTAAPAAATVRRVIPQESRRKSGQA